jgi:hypothetical protein
MRDSLLSGCLLAALRLPLIALLAVTTSWSLFETFLVNLDARSAATAFVAGAGADVLTPNLIDQSFVKLGYQEVEQQATAQPAGLMYFPFVRVPLPAAEVAGKDVATVLQAIYLHVAGAYYDHSGFDGILGLTPPQAREDAPVINQVCPLVASSSGNLPPGLDLNTFLAELAGQNSPGQSGSTPLDPAQAQQFVKVARILCTSIQRGNGLTGAEISTIVSTLGASVGTTGSNGSNGSSIASIPSIPDLSHNPYLGFVGLTQPLSAAAERATTDRQRWGLGVSAVLALLLALLSRRWGRLLHGAIGVLLGGSSGLAVVAILGQIQSRNRDLFLPYATPIHALVAAFTPPYVVATLAGGLGILVATGGTIVAKALAARAGQTAAGQTAAGQTAAAGLAGGAGRAHGPPAPVGAYQRPQMGSAGFAPEAMSEEPTTPSVYTSLPVESNSIPALTAEPLAARVEHPSGPPISETTPSSPIPAPDIGDDRGAETAE